MREDESTVGGTVTKDLAGTLIRVGLITFIVVMCARVFAPFADLIVWALILAIALYPMHQHLARRMGGRQGGAATVVVLAGLLIIGVPTVMLSASFASHLSDAHAAFQNNTITIKQPASTVADWPVIGNRVYRTWSAAADNLPDFLEQNKEQFKNIAKRVLEAAVSSAGSVLMFLGSLIAAGIMMAYGESGAQRVRHIFTSVAGPITGSRLQGLTTATVRSVATGVIGVAFIQALLLGVGFMLAGIPAAGVLAAVVMLIGIMQLPALIISLPVVAYMWSSGDASTTSNIAWTIYLLVAGSADNVLKPLLLGRGVDVPMLVILIGALGGMVTSGIIGLFAGAVLMAVGYQIFIDWLDHSDQASPAND